MNWIRERDALIAQTLAFVQSVTGKKDGLQPPEPAGPGAIPATTEVETDRAIAVEAGPLPASPPSFAVVQPRMSGDFRTEMQARIANFRKHQERFEREREEYCAATLGRLRAAIRDGAARPPAEN